MNVRETLLEAANSIARRDAETLLAHLLQRNRAWLIAHDDNEVPEAQRSELRKLTARRAAHEPLQYLIGIQEFYGLPLKVTRDTLIPRPETELLVEEVLEWTAHHPATIPLRLLDVGTGTGAIALALAKHLPGAQITACDLSAAALDVAQQNATSLQLGNRIHFLLSDLMSALPTDAQFDIVVSNPPYVPTTDAATMQPDVRDFEPHTALFAGDDGLDIYRRLIPQAHAALRRGGLLALEFGFGQRDALRTLLHGWNNMQFLDDYAGIPRIALAERAEF